MPLSKSASPTFLNEDYFADWLVGTVITSQGLNLWHFLWTTQFDNIPNLAKSLVLTENILKLPSLCASWLLQEAQGHISCCTSLIPTHWDLLSRGMTLYNGADGQHDIDRQLSSRGSLFGWHSRINSLHSPWVANGIPKSGYINKILAHCIKKWHKPHKVACAHGASYITPPPFLLSHSNEDLINKAKASPLSPCNIPCHSQNVERLVVNVTAASKLVAGHEKKTWKTSEHLGVPKEYTQRIQ